MKLSFFLLALVAAEKMTTQVEETGNMHLVTDRLARDQSCLPAGQCMNPYCSLYDCYEKNNKPLCAGEKLDVANTPTEAKVGIHHNIKIGYLSKWTTKLDVRYSNNAMNNDLRVTISNWNTKNLWMFVGAQHANDRSKDYYIGAFAPTKRVFSRCNNSRHSGYRTLGANDCIHGAYWYCVLNWSFGFTAHSSVKLQQADTYGVWNNKASGAHNHRLSWHMLAWYKAGWRAGGAYSMNGESKMFKIVKTRQCNACGKPAPPKFTSCKSTFCQLQGSMVNVFATKVHNEKWSCKKTGNSCICECHPNNKCTLTNLGISRHHC